MMDENVLSIAIPNKGRLSENVTKFLDLCGLKVHRESERQCHATLKGINSPIPIQVRFQRARDITRFVSKGGTDFGITGYDLFCESGGDDNNDLIMVFDNLEFGECDLTIAVPDDWV